MECYEYSAFHLGQYVVDGANVVGDGIGKCWHCSWRSWFWLYHKCGRTKATVIDHRHSNICTRRLEPWAVYSEVVLTQYQHNFCQKFQTIGENTRIDLASFSIRFIELITIFPFSIRGALVSSVIFALNAGRLMAYVFGMLCKFEFKELNKNEIEHSD